MNEERTFHKAYACETFIHGVVRAGYFTTVMGTTCIVRGSLPPLERRYYRSPRNPAVAKLHSSVSQSPPAYLARTDGPGPRTRCPVRLAFSGYVPAPASRPEPSVLVRPPDTDLRPSRIPQRRPGACLHRKSADRFHTGRAPLGRGTAPSAGLALAAAPRPASGIDTGGRGRARAGAGISPSNRPARVGLRPQLVRSAPAATAPTPARHWGIPPAEPSSLSDR